ncbi:hypothetical protein Bca101_000261 [Brassica carinata]
MDLEGRKFAWIIRVKGTEKNYKQPSFKVFKLTDKPEVIHKFQDNVTMEVENTSSEANDNDLPSSSPMTPTTQRDNEAIVLMMKEFKNHQQSLRERLKRLKQKVVTK